jgi:hypothetical protein
MCHNRQVVELLAKHELYCPICTMLFWEPTDKIGPNRM